MTLGHHVTILDGGLGTELSRRGCDTSPPLWSARPLLDAPDVVTAIHREYVAAGAQMLTTCTFRTHARNLARAEGRGRHPPTADDANTAAVEAARRAIASGSRRGLRVAGGISPLEDCYRPDLVPDDDALRAEHAAQAESLRRAGADLLLVETMNTRREAAAAVRASVATGLETWCSFVTSGAGRLLSGEPLADAAREAEDLGAQALLVNCVPIERVAAEVEILLRTTDLAVGAYPNNGHPTEGGGFDARFLVDPAVFCDALAECRLLGAEILGGCCGTGPAEIAALVAAMAAG